jgi:hypothetical protein
VLAAVDRLDYALTDLSAVDAVMDKLIKAPNAPVVQGEDTPAPARLVSAIVELGQIFKAMDHEFGAYFALSFSEPQSAEERDELAKRKEKLHRLATGETQERLREMRGHCGMIKTIYLKYLDDWFTSIPLEQHELADLYKLFVQDMDEFDGDMIHAITEIAEWMKAQAMRTLEYLNDEKYDLANHHIRQTHKMMLPAEQKIWSGLDCLNALQSELMKIAV